MADDQHVMRPLPIFPYEELTDEIRAKIVRAKQSLNTPIMAQFARGVPGSDRVLALGRAPDFACDYAPVADINSPGLPAAVAYVLHLNDDPRAQTVAGWLSNTLGAQVKEVQDASEQDPGGIDHGGPERGGVDPGEQPPARIGGVGDGTAQRPIDAGPRGPIDPNSYSDGNYRAALRASYSA